jgi:hypothetical protein
MAALGARAGGEPPIDLLFADILAIDDLVFSSKFLRRFGRRFPLAAMNLPVTRSSFQNAGLRWSATISRRLIHQHAFEHFALARLGVVVGHFSWSFSGFSDGRVGPSVAPSLELRRSRRRLASVPQVVLRLIMRRRSRSRRPRSLSGVACGVATRLAAEGDGEELPGRLPVVIIGLT